MFTTKEVIKCPYCPPSTKLIEDFQAGDLICSGCGLVIGDRVIDVGAEWRTFSNDTLMNKSRVGAEENLLYHGMDLSTMVGTLGPAVVAPTLDENGERKYRNKKFLSSTQRTLVSGFKEIAEMGEKLNTTRPVVECAQLLFKKIQTKHALKGRSNEAIAAACLYVAYRKNSVARTFKEVCAVAKANKRDIGKCYKVLSKMIGEAISQPTLIEYLPRFSAHLHLPAAVDNRARSLLSRFEKNGILSGRSPSTVLALAIYMVIEQLTASGTVQSFFSGDAKAPSIRTIAEVTGAAETTIRDAHQLIRTQAIEHFSEYFPDVDDPKLVSCQIQSVAISKSNTIETSVKVADPAGPAVVMFKKPSLMPPPFKKKVKPANIEIEVISLDDDDISDELNKKKMA